MNFGAEKVDLSVVDFTPELLRYVPAEVARKYRVLPVFNRPGCLSIALSRADDLNLIDNLAHILMQPGLEILVADGQQLDLFIYRLYGN